MKYNNRIEYQRKWRKKNRERIREASGLWRSKNRDKCSEYTEIWNEKNPWYSHFNMARSRCKPGGDYFGIVSFSMSVEHFKFLWFRDKAYLMKKPSIDRIKGNKHYTLKNCQFLELTINRIKKFYIGWTKYGVCLDCGRNDKKYYAQGRCSPCYQRTRRNENLFQRA